MQIKKFVATGLTALMAGATLMGGAYAASSGLGAYPSTFDNGGNLDGVIVVGANAAASDVVGAIDVAANLASLSYTNVQTSGTTSGATGALDKDGITLGLSANPTSGNLGTGANAFPTITALKNAHYSGLWQGTFTYNSTTVSAHEEVDLSQGGGVEMRHDLATNNINGTEKMVVGTNGNIVARYKFDTSVLVGGTISTPQYTKPLTITFLGKPFTITGVGTGSIKMLSGQVGTAVKDPTTRTGVTFNGYTVYVTAASDGAWATLEIDDATGKAVDTISNVRSGDTKTSTIAGIDIKMTAAPRVTGTDPTTQHMEADIVVGNTGSTEYEYDSTADTSTTSKELFPGTTNWYITYSANGGSAGTIASGASINAEYRPSTTQYLSAGNGVALPNNYGTLTYKGFNTQNFATVTISPISSTTGYNSTDNSLVGSVLYGLQITADGNSVGSGALVSPNWYPAMYLLFNQTVTNGTADTVGLLPVIVGYKNSKGHIQVNDSLTTASISYLESNQTLSNVASGATSAVSPVTELGYGYLGLNGSTTGTVTFPFKLNYNGVGDTSFWLNLTVKATNSGNPGLPFINGSIANINLGSTNTFNSGTSGALYFAFNNKTTFIANTANLGSDLLKLGDTASSAEAKEINITTEGVSNNAGTLTQTAVGDSGVQVVNSQGNGGSDQLVVLIPSKVLGNEVYFGSTGTGTSTTTSSGTVKQVAAITSSIAKLDTELTAADKKHSIVTVGGPAVNSLSAQLLGVPFPSYGAASGIAENTVLIQRFQDFFTPGEVVVLVAGFTADNTRLGTSVLQQYATKLAGVTANAVTLTGTVASPGPVTPVAAPATPASNATKGTGK